MRAATFCGRCDQRWIGHRNGPATGKSSHPRPRCSHVRPLKCKEHSPLLICVKMASVQLCESDVCSKRKNKNAAVLCCKAPACANFFLCADCDKYHHPPSNKSLSNHQRVPVPQDSHIAVPTSVAPAPTAAPAPAPTPVSTLTASTSASVKSLHAGKCFKCQVHQNCFD